MARYDSQGRRLCTATTRAGNPCRAPALKGATVCNKHGGQLPNVKAKAHRTLLEELIEPALLRAMDMIRDDQTPPATTASLIRTVLEWTTAKPTISINSMPSAEQVYAWITELEADETA